MAHLQGKERSDYVQDMFGRVAKNYNRINRIMTFGQDMRWRRFVIKQAQLSPGNKILDLATGTGDIAFEAHQATNGLQVVGADFALPMMQIGKQFAQGDQVDWCGADALRLPFPDNSFDAVASGFLVRNVIDLPQTLTEQLRILKPGGRIVILDSSPPPNNILRPFILIHLKYIIPTLGRLISGKQAADAYRYLPESTRSFKTPDELASLMQEAGYESVKYQMFMFGTVAVHWGQKP